MLTLVHGRSKSDDKASGWHAWHFCYFHGNLENANNDKFAAGGDAPDLFEANRPIENYLPTEPKRPYSVTWVECIACGKPAIVGIKVEWNITQKYVSGRVAWKDDPDGLRHVMTPEDWR